METSWLAIWLILAFLGSSDHLLWDGTISSELALLHQLAIIVSRVSSPQTQTQANLI